MVTDVMFIKSDPWECFGKDASVADFQIWFGRIHDVLLWYLTLAHTLEAFTRGTEDTEIRYIVFSPETGENTIQLALRAADGVLTWEMFSLKHRSQ